MTNPLIVTVPLCHPLLSLSNQSAISALKSKLSSLSTALRTERANHSRTKSNASIKLTKLREEVERVKGENEGLKRGRSKGTRKGKERVGRSTTPRGRNGSYDRPTSASRGQRTPSTGGSRGSKNSRGGGNKGKRDASMGSNSNSRGRSRSAPRFDPTEYVMEKKRKDEERRRRREWENSPARSVGSKGSVGGRRSVGSRGSSVGSSGSSVGSRGGKQGKRTWG